nr:hypothetical protein [Conexibacter sp. DBS9H8]
MFGGPAPAHAGTGVAETMGQPDDPVADLVAHRHGQLDRADPGADAHPIAVGEAPGDGVFGMEQRGAAVLTLHQPGGVVHP